MRIELGGIRQGDERGGRVGGRGRVRIEVGGLEEGGRVRIELGGWKIEVGRLEGG